MKDENYEMKQKIARRIKIYAAETPFGMRFRGRSAYDSDWMYFYQFVKKIIALEGTFASQVAQTVNSKTPDNRIAWVSDKQAWILACAAVDNGIEL